MDAPQTLIEAVRYFSDIDRCKEIVRSARAPRPRPVCSGCGRPVGTAARHSVRHGTIMYDSRLPLSAWLSAMWALADDHSITSVALAAAIGVQQPTCAKMLRRLREIDTSPPSFERLLKRVVRRSAR